MVGKESKLSRRSTALVWFLAVAIVIGTLIYLEQIAILYVLATISLVALLLIVAFADLYPDEPALNKSAKEVSEDADVKPLLAKYRHDAFSWAG